MNNLTANHIAECEAELDASLPQSYRAAMLEKNGGDVLWSDIDWELYPIYGAKQPSDRTSSDMDLLEHTELAAKWYGFPNRALAIARNMFGDKLILLRIGRTYSHRVYYFSHDTGETFCIADDFSELQRI